MTITTCVFDAYGTLFDVNAAARLAAEDNPALADVWSKLAADWRAKQLQYTWLRAITGAHDDFWQVTKDGLDWAMEASGLDDPALRNILLDLYWNLPAYAEVPGMLDALKKAGLQTAILSNGSPAMLDAAVSSAGLDLDVALSVESVGIYKPDARVYDLVGQHFGCDKKQVLFVSANGWDAAGATGYGFTVAWANRAGDPVDRMPWSPAHTIADLTPIPTLAGAL